MTRSFSVGLGLLTLSFCAAPAFGWGDDGHRIVCEIAFQEMSRPARDAIKRLIAIDDEYVTFSDSCIWPDHPKSRNAEHFINVPRTLASVSTTRCPESDTCLFTAIDQDSKILANETGSPGARLRALKYLGHWVGDLHQPLHVSYVDDRGGNHIDIDEAGLCSFNLHSVWDTCLVEAQLGTGDPRRIAEKLRMEITDEQREEWTNAEPKDWANESYQLAVGAQTRYCVPVDGVCQYDGANATLDKFDERKVITIDEAYVSANGPIVRERIVKAGVRLGKLLDRLLRND